MASDTDPPPKRPRRAPGVVRVALAWSQLFAAATMLRALAATAGWLTPSALAAGLLGPGAMAIVGALLACLGLGRGLLAPRRSGWRTPVLFVLLVFHASTLAVFPPRWLLGRFQDGQTLFYVGTEQAAFALTIDDGLDPDATPLILETLARHRAHATFFVLGETLEQNADLAERCLAEGHELANHQMRDQPAFLMAPDELAESIRETHRRLEPFTTPVWRRPGGGFVTERDLAVSSALGYRVALGSVFPFDSHLPSARFVAAYVAGRTGPGDIVVLHDGGERGERTSAALDAALPQLAARGLRAVTLSELASSD